MVVVYRFLLGLAKVLVWLLNATRLVLLWGRESKFRKFVLGRRKFPSLQIPESASLRVCESAVWVHCSSLGEYGIMRPIVNRLREAGEEVVLTFFSPTGYEAIEGSYYLPLDTRGNARRFINTIRPKKVLFAVSEIWPNYLFELQRQGIPTYLVSAKITPRSSVMRWYGSLFLKALKTIDKIMVLDSTSEALLRSKGVEQVIKTGDPLFDNALTIANQEFKDEAIEKWCEGRRVFIAGSVHDCKDLNMVVQLVKAFPEDRFIIAPHEIKTKNLQAVRAALEGADNYMLIDTMGYLSRIYRYCSYAYVGGGFTPYLHSIIEPVVYGLPVSYGPMMHRKNTPSELIELGVGAKVETGEELISWYRKLRNNERLLSEISRRAKAYTLENSGSTDTVIKLITN